jgi:hypothetical protein
MLGDVLHQILNSLAGRLHPQPQLKVLRPVVVPDAVLVVHVLAIDEAPSKLPLHYVHMLQQPAAADVDAPVPLGRRGDDASHDKGSYRTRLACAPHSRVMQPAVERALTGTLAAIDRARLPILPPPYLYGLGSSRLAMNTHAPAVHLAQAAGPCLLVASVDSAAILALPCPGA